ncbi:MAG: ornithine cyclodeaminase family protein [Pseudomonadales bacterium]
MAPSHPDASPKPLPSAFPGLALLGPEACAKALPYPALIRALAKGFAEGAMVSTPRQHVRADSGREALVGLAWRDGGALGLKALTLFPENPARGLPQIQGLYTLFDGETGAPRAILDAGTLTERRTAATAALAAQHLSRSDATHLLVLGTGRLARALPEAHGAVRPLTRVTVWGRRPSAVDETVRDLRERFPALTIEGAEDLQAAVDACDMVTSALPSETPLLSSAWLRPGQHVDLIGSYRPTMAEIDGGALRRATVFVDTEAGAWAEAGELIQAEAAGQFSRGEVAGTLSDLAAGRHPGRQSREEITLFKAAGSAAADYFAAALALGRTAS